MDYNWNESEYEHRKNLGATVFEFLRKSLESKVPLDIDVD
jgi:hypothetical protein